MLTVGSLFSGIGGFDLGLERTGGFAVKWQVEIDPYARQVLRQHWPHTTIWKDIRTFPAIGTAAGLVWHRPEWEVDLLCGGFPCQDISLAGRGAGIAGRRSGLWSEFVRIIRLLDPRYVLVENVAALLGRGMGVVLSDLAACWYDAEWQCIPVAAAGAPHIRDRVFILAYRRGSRRQGTSEIRSRECVSLGSGQTISDSHGHIMEEPRDGAPTLRSTGGDWWSTEPDVGRMAHGVPARVDRLRCRGIAVCPPIIEWIGNRILACESRP